MQNWIADAQEITLVLGNFYSILKLTGYTCAKKIVKIVENMHNVVSGCLIFLQFTQEYMKEMHLLVSQIFIPVNHCHTLQTLS